MGWQRPSQLCMVIYWLFLPAFLPQVLLPNQFCALLARSQCLPLGDIQLQQSAIVAYDKRPNLSPALLNDCSMLAAQIAGPACSPLFNVTEALSQPQSFL